MAQITREEFNKQVAVIRAWLLGKGWHTALAALEFGLEKHVGTRKDGVSPEFSHQMFIARFVATLESVLEHPEESVAAALLHDTPEDLDVTYEEIERRFGKTVRDAVELLTKKYRGVRVPDEVYYARMAENAIASVVKGVDRLHNIYSMHAADWTRSKQQDYLDFVSTFVLPMLKTARRRFTKQNMAYEIVKGALNMQTHTIQLLLDAKSA